MANPSPLRYPGGKYKISRLVELLIQRSGDNRDVYVEPFAGGAGVAIDLLNRNIVAEIVINDSDRAIYSFWKAVVEENDAFLDMIATTPVTIDEWKRQRTIYQEATKYTLEYGFATFFLNRVNHSGILSAGPIGGVGQDNDEYKLDVRFDKESLSRKIELIGRLRDRIHVYNRDVLSFINRQLKAFEKRAFVYFDPPYYKKGKALYKNFFTDKLQLKLHDAILKLVHCPWIVSYDNVPEIRGIYKELPRRTFSLCYSLANNGYGKEIMFFKSKKMMPTDEELNLIGMLKAFSSDRSSVSI